MIKEIGLAFSGIFFEVLIVIGILLAPDASCAALADSGCPTIMTTINNDDTKEESINTKWKAK